MTSLRRLALSTLSRVPWVYLNVVSWRANRHIARVERGWECDRVARDVIAQIGAARCIAGPFRNVELPRETWTRHISPKLLGTYESELHATLEACCARRYRRVIDIGAADGFYAAGLAMRLGQRVVAFEADPWQRYVIRRTAAVNRADVDVRGPATVRSVARVVEPGSLLLCDCEGAEDALLDPLAIPGLARCDLVVEVHDAFVPGVAERLRRRFHATHDIREIPAEPEKRPPGAIAALAPADRALAVREHRAGGCAWMVFETRMQLTEWTETTARNGATEQRRDRR